jgi:hypothetical protein
VSEKLDIKMVIHSRPYTTATDYPMARLNKGSIGHLPVDEFGNQFILVIID